MEPPAQHRVGVRQWGAERRASMEARDHTRQSPGAVVPIRGPVPPRLPPGLTARGGAIMPRRGEMLAVIVARDEALRLPDALAAARRLGVDRVIVLDNGSTDATGAVAEGAGAHVILAEGDYAAVSRNPDVVAAYLGSEAPTEAAHG